MKQLSIRLPDDEFTFIKTFASAHKLTLQNFVMSAIQAKVAEMSAKNKISEESNIHQPLSKDEKIMLNEAKVFYSARSHLKAENVILLSDFMEQIKSGCGAEKMAEMMGYTKEDWESMK
ncbi:TPA: hypothetical protein PW360_000013 [Mannheimia haemolytica]|nr:hypothetical protein [Mannheimia haemolytica]